MSLDLHLYCFPSEYLSAVSAFTLAFIESLRLEKSKRPLQGLFHQHQPLNYVFKILVCQVENMAGRDAYVLQLCSSRLPTGADSLRKILRITCLYSSYISTNGLPKECAFRCSLCDSMTTLAPCLIGADENLKHNLITQAKCYLVLLLPNTRTSLQTCYYALAKHQQHRHRFYLPTNTLSSIWLIIATGKRNKLCRASMDGSSQSMDEKNLPAM